MSSMPKSSEPKTLSEAIERLVEDLEPELEEMKKKAEGQIEKKPLMAVGITALLFLVIGFFLGRGSKK